MKLFIGVTDKDWFNYLSGIKPDEVNFWRPGGKFFSAIEVGAPFLFKLRYPDNKIVGGGFFIRSDQLPLSLAWDAFKEKNGAKSIDTLRDKINSLRRYPEIDPKIGCIILNQPFFFSEEKWINVPDSWMSNIVTGKTYDTMQADGLILWNEVLDRLNEVEVTSSVINQQPSIFGKEYLVKARLGQGAFRILVTSAYSNNCAVTGEKALPVLQAAHIRPYTEDGPNKVSNGVLLRSDLHILFDRGYMTITPDFKIEISKRIKEEFHNGKNYYALHGKVLQLPNNKEDHPDKFFIEWHNNNIFR